jgi:cytochrome P450
MPDRNPPDPPPAPIFDRAKEAWIFSRYADVLAAFREERLVPIGNPRQQQSVPQDASHRLKLRTETMAALSPARLAEWRKQFAVIANRRMEELAKDRPVDLIGEFLQQWCVDIAIVATGADPADRARLMGLASQLSAFTKDPVPESRAAAARAELGQVFSNRAMGEPAFVALSQTLPCFLGNAWLELLRNPGQLERLQKQPHLMPGAVEELLRYAGVTQKLFRRAAESVSLGGVTIAAGQAVILMIASANRDPDQFANPDHLDIARRPAGQLGLGAAAHSCVGAALIRMAAAVATAALIGKVDPETVNPRVAWGAGADCPSVIEVRLASLPEGR